jgi:MFS family permease
VTAEGGAVALSAAHRRFLIRDALVIAAVINGTLSALIAWLVTLGEDEVPNAAVPLIEGPSVVVDTVGTFFVLPFLTTLLITTVIWKELREGHLTRVPLPAGSFAERLPDTRLRRAAVIGLLCLLALGPIGAVVLVLLDYGGISITEFVIYKAIVGIVLGAVVTPPIAMVAFADEPPPAELPSPAA